MSLGLPPSTKIYLALAPCDMRKGFDGLAAQVKNILELDPFSGAAFFFRGKKANRLKALVWDGTGLCLYAKRLEGRKFSWPTARDGALRISPAQMALLVEGLDWKKAVVPDDVRTPTLAWKSTEICRFLWGHAPDSAMHPGMRFDLDRLPTDPVLLHKMLREMAEVIGITQDKLKVSEATVKALKLHIEKVEHRLSCLLRVQYGRSSEKQDIAQLRLMFDEVVTPQAANDEAPAPEQSATPNLRKPGRREPLPDHLPRQTVQHDVASCDADCPGPLVQIDESVTEVLDYVPARFRVIRHVRPRMACRHCERIHQVPAADLPLPKVMATSALHAHLLVSRFVDHQPWNRQSVIFRRAGVHIDRDVMSRWARKLAWLMAPLGDRLLAYILEGDKVHGDDTPVTLLGNGSEIGRFWVYLKHGHSSGDMSPAAVAFRFSEDRSGDHPAEHLASYRGYFQADAFAGYNALYRDPKTKAPRDIVEVGCWAHVRRKFTDILDKSPSPIAAEAVVRIGELFAIERDIEGTPPDTRRRMRQSQAVPLLDALEQWLEKQLRGLSSDSTLARACRYPLKRWAAMTRYCEDGVLEISNNLCENALRGVSLGRKNWLFVGSVKGGEATALFYSLVETCRLNGIEPEAYLTDVIERIGSHPINRIDELLPWNWRASQDIKLVA